MRAQLALMTFALLTGSSAFAAGTIDTGDFTLTAKGKQVCKARANQPDLCYEATANDAGVIVKASVSITDASKACQAIGCSLDSTDISAAQLEQIDGALFLTGAGQKSLLAEYQELTLSHFGVDSAQMAENESEITMPCVLSLTWKKGDRSGTVQVDGVMHFDKVHPLSDFTGDARLTALNKILEVKAMSGMIDSQAQTLSLLTDVAGPFAVAHGIYIPMMKATAMGIQEISNLFSGSAAN